MRALREPAFKPDGRYPTRCLERVARSVKSAHTPILPPRSTDPDMSTKPGISALLSAFAFTGCATVTGGDIQQVSLQTRGSANEPVDNATCTLQQVTTAQ
jgi:hypothetical protein